MNRFPFAGRTFEVNYGDLIATNSYAADKNSLIYEITHGPPEGRNRRSFLRMAGA